MYLGHHYVVDLVGGGCYAIIAFWIGSSFLPSVTPYSDMLMGSIEKQTFVQSFNHYYPIGARRNEEDWGLELNDRDMKARESSSDSTVVEVEEGVGGMGCDESSFQSWNGWQGYESWAMIILSARSGYSIPQHVPITSTRFMDKGLFQELSDNVQQEQQEQEQQQQQQEEEHVNLDYEAKYISPQLSPGLVASVAEEVISASTCNVAIPAGTGEADDGIKRLTRSVHLSFSPSSSVSGSSLPNSPMKANFLEPDVAVPTVVPGLLMTISSSLSSSSPSATTTLSSPSSSSPSYSPISSPSPPSPLSSVSFLSSISSLSLPNLTGAGAGAGTTEQGRESNPGLFLTGSSSETSSSSLFISTTTAVMTSIAMTTTATTTNSGVNISANKRFKDD
ncbi:hypothetical protein BGZ80_002453 [Entomortierella chlamydospora]|uniref:Phosphatidic acid phosphatase type 2/haloperoxidase domain-containing protein n=1 Tax=Entomortierella chlamydospora TaxID=101097 RepID=A0A9P6MQ89_9FUNG|nr:hypothetical protein BGZ80_002453 [Entomortierella chlamydospora]